MRRERPPPLRNTHTKGTGLVRSTWNIGTDRLQVAKLDLGWSDRQKKRQAGKGLIHAGIQRRRTCQKACLLCSSCTASAVKEVERLALEDRTRPPPPPPLLALRRRPGPASAGGSPADARWGPARWGKFGGVADHG